jgi:hypothetical protein
MENSSSSSNLVEQTYTIGTSTDSAALSDQVKRYRSRRLKEPASNELKKDVAGDLSKEPLTLKCIKVIVANFAKSPAHSGVPAKHMREIAQQLPIDLDAGIAAVYVHDENYWKRRCMQSLAASECQIIEHGLTWKQLYFEHHLRKRLESFEADEDGAKLEPLLDEIRK